MAQFGHAASINNNSCTTSSTTTTTTATGHQVRIIVVAPVGSFRWRSVYFLVIFPPSRFVSVVLETVWMLMLLLFLSLK